MDRPGNGAGPKSESSTADDSGLTDAHAPASTSQRGRTLLRVFYLGFVVFATLLVALSTGVSAVPATTKARSCVSVSWIATHPKTILFVRSHPSLLKEFAAHSRVASDVVADPSAKNIAAAERAFGPSGLASLARYKTQLATLVQPYAKQVSCLRKHPDNQISAAG
jgi:hypothetical protein